MEIKAFDIGLESREIILTDIMIGNINNIFNQILGGNSYKSNHLSVKCSLANENQNESNVLFNYLKNKNKFDYNVFADKLLAAEKNKIGDCRKKSIQEGFLFVKSHESSLYLMKLQKIEDVDAITFELKGALGSDNNYYKLCVFEKDFDNIIIVDKNTKLAQYWFQSFLGLVRQRNEDDNTKLLVRLIEEKKLFNNNIVDSNSIDKLYKITENYLFDNKLFDKSILKDLLNSKLLIDENELSNVFSTDSCDIDFEFNLSDKIMKEKYKKVMKISDDTEIKTDNLKKLQRRKGIAIKDNKIILTISDDYLPKIREILSKSEYE